MLFIYFSIFNTIIQQKSVIFMKNNFKKIFFTSFGLTIKELKKSFILTYITKLIFYGIVILFATILLKQYQNISTESNANVFFINTILFITILSLVLFYVLNRLRKLTYLEVLRKTMHKKTPEELEKINYYLDNHFSKQTFRKIFNFIILEIFLILLIIMFYGIYLLIPYISLKIIYSILLLLIAPILMELFFGSFYLRGLKETILNIKNIFSYESYLLALFFSISTIGIVILLISISNSITLDTILGLILSFVTTFNLYFLFYISSFTFLEKKI